MFPDNRGSHHYVHVHHSNVVLMLWHNVVLMLPSRCSYIYKHTTTSLYWGCYSVDMKYWNNFWYFTEVIVLLGGFTWGGLSGEICLGRFGTWILEGAVTMNWTRGQRWTLATDVIRIQHPRIIALLVWNSTTDYYRLSSHNLQGHTKFKWLNPWDVTPSLVINPLSLTSAVVVVIRATITQMSTGGVTETQLTLGVVHPWPEGDAGIILALTTHPLSWTPVSPPWG